MALKRGRADFDFCLKILEAGLNGFFLDEVVVHKRERQGSVCGSYPHRYGRICEHIVENHSETFKDDELRKQFLGSGYLHSSWGCFKTGRMKRAAWFANKGLRLHGTRPYWPLQYGSKLPAWFLSLLVNTRLACGKFARLITGTAK